MVRRAYAILIAVAALSGCARDADLLAPRIETAVVQSGGAVAASLELPDPVFIANEYLAMSFHLSLPVPLGTLGSDPESISDSTYEALGPQLVSDVQAPIFEADGEAVGEMVYQRLLAGGGGGGAGGVEPMGLGISTLSDDEVVYPEEWCDEMYEKAKARCRRLRSAKSKSLCWGASVVAYGACRAMAE